MTYVKPLIFSQPIVIDNRCLLALATTKFKLLYNISVDIVVLINIWQLVFLDQPLRHRSTTALASVLLNFLLFSFSIDALKYSQLVISSLQHLVQLFVVNFFLLVNIVLLFRLIFQKRTLQTKMESITGPKLIRLQISNRLTKNASRSSSVLRLSNLPA